MMFRYAAVTAVFAAALMLGLTGCNRPATSTDASHEHEHDGHEHDGHDHGEHDHDHEAGDHKHDKQSSSGHDHSGWWCGEHGVPEHQCGLCDPKVAAALKKKGDWCTEHDRPDSQCFICHPEHEAKFAALYEAKYGKAPPKMN